MRGQQVQPLAHPPTGARSALEQSVPPTAAAPTAAGGANRTRVWRRVLRVLAFDRSVYPEVERDPAGTRQAAVVVAVVAAAAAVGTALAGSWYPGAILGAVLAALTHWVLWSGLDHLIGRALFRSETSLKHSVRSLGYAEVPEFLALFDFVPVVGSWVVLGGRLLTMLAGSQATRTTLGLDRRQALAIRLVSFAIALVAAAVVRAALGDVPFLRALLRP